MTKFAEPLVARLPLFQRCSAQIQLSLPQGKRKDNDHTDAEGKSTAPSAVFDDKSDKWCYKDPIILIEISFPTMKLDSLKRKLDFFETQTTFFKTKIWLLEA